MATTTTNFGWDIPQSTDLVKDGATAIAALGQDIDTALVDLKGGTTGQVLAKASNTDLDYSWVAQDDSNAIQNAIVDAKGDLIAATAADTPARLAVGNNGETLVADSSTATGLKWGVGNNRGASVYNSANLTIANNTFTALTFNSELYDTDSYHSTSTNTSRITIPTGLGGQYLITSTFQWDLSAVGGRFFKIYKNGSSIFEAPEMIGSATVYVGPTISTILSLSAGDYIEIYVRQTSGGNLIAYPGSPNTPFAVSLLGA
jgi:hypothetical protein